MIFTSSPCLQDGLPCDVVLCILQRLTLADLLVFAKVSLIARDLVRHELRARHRRMLRRFVRNPSGLLGLLDQTQSIISGSFALNYAYGQCPWTATDLDLYVSPQRLEEVLTYLTTVEDYNVCLRPDTREQRLSKSEKRRL